MDGLILLSIEEVRSLLHRFDRFVLTTHANPDGDALGSEAALSHALRQEGKSVSVINCHPVPANLSFLDNGGLFQTYDSSVHDAVIAGVDAIVVLDLNDVSRVGRMASPVRDSAAYTMVIDHHLDPRAFADGYLIDQNACATSEILYTLLEDRIDLGPDVAMGLYTGIMTDTGSFRFERTTPRVHRIAARLLEAGVDPTAVYRRVYDEYPAGRSVLLGRVLAGMQLVCGGRASILRVTRQDLAETSTTLEDLDSLVNYGLGIRGVEASVMLTEVPEGVKMNFRSRGSTSVHALAISFGGGGHRCAAGATVSGTGLDAVYARVRAALPGIMPE